MKFSMELYQVVRRGLRMAGTYDPEEVLSFIEEELTPSDVAVVEAFLTWCHEHNKVFGDTSWQRRFDEFRSSCR